MESEKQSIVNNELNLICLKGICQGSVIKTAKGNKRCIVYLRRGVILYGKCHDKNKSSPMVIYFVSSAYLYNNFTSFKDVLYTLRLL